LVDVVVVGAGEDEPGVLDITGFERATLDVRGCLRDLISHVRCDDDDLGPGCAESRCPSCCHMAAADDDHTLTSQVEEEREPGVVHPAIVSPPPTCHAL
jgi:hypothetical protein